MFLTKLIAYYSVFISLPLACSSDEELDRILVSDFCRPRTPQFCRGGIDLKFHNREVYGRSGRPKQYFDYVKHKDQKIPQFFDARKKWPKCRSIFQIKDQNDCAYSWALSAAMSTTDRSCIASEGRKLWNVSEHDLLTCCHTCYPPKSFDILRCITGANLITPFHFMVSVGVVSGECKPYDTKTLGGLYTCQNICNNKRTSYKKLKIRRYSLGIRRESTIKDMQIEILKNGPVAGILEETPSDFQLNYTNKVYINTKKSKWRGLPTAIRILGWGTENRVPYWICANSWGTKWGKLGGFFKIRRGTNELGIEHFFIAADLRLRKTDKPSDEIYNPAGANINIRTGYSGTSYTKKQLYKITVIVLIIFIF